MKCGIFQIINQVSNRSVPRRRHGGQRKEDTRGVIDYWQDQDKNNIKVKGWTNGKYVVVLYAASQNELAETKVNAFLDGLVFP